MKLRYTRHALNDLVGQLEFIAKDDVVAAQNVSRSIRAGIDRLVLFPSYGRVGDVKGTRQFVVSGMPYVVVYEVDAEMVTILRIYHAAQDRAGSR